MSHRRPFDSARRLINSKLLKLGVSVLLVVLCIHSLLLGGDDLTFAEKEAIVQRMLHQTFDAVADNDYQSAYVEAKQLLEHPFIEDYVQDTASDLPIEIAWEIQDICMLPKTARCELTSAFNEFRTAGLTGVTEEGADRLRLQAAIRGEALLNKYFPTCPSLYTNLSLRLARRCRHLGHFQEARRIADRATTFALSQWGESSWQYAYALCEAIYVSHIDELPSDAESTKLRWASNVLREHLRQIEPRFSRRHFGMSEIRALCELRDGNPEEAREIAAAAIRESHKIESEVAANRWSFEMLEVQALIALGRRNEGLEKFESFQENFVECGIGFLSHHAKAYTAVIEAYKAKGQPEKIPEVLWLQRKSSAQIDLSRMSATLKGDVFVSSSITREKEDVILHVNEVRKKTLDVLSKGDLQSANKGFAELLDLERQHPQRVAWDVDTEWISQDIRRRIGRVRPITETERTAIMMSWRVLGCDVDSCPKLISHRTDFALAVECDGQHTSASAFYLHWALAAAYRATGQFDEAHRELDTAHQILKSIQRERSLLGLLVVRDEMFLAAIRRDATFDHTSILLPYELQHPIDPFQAHYAASCYTAFASYCYMREEYMQAWQMAYCAGIILWDGQIHSLATREWSFVAVSILANACLKVKNDPPEERLQYLESFRQEYEEGGNPRFPELAWYFYEMSAKVADRCGLSKKAAELRISSKLAITPLDE